MATMRDVAERANVSIATVSFVVNETKPVSPATRARILAAMEELGFRRNAVARALASRRTRIVALVFPALELRISAFVAAAADAARARGYNLVLWPVANDADQLTELIAGGFVDGVLLMEVQVDDPRVDLLVEHGIPFALIGRTRDPSGITYVDMDFESMVPEAVEYLERLGHRDFALVTHDLGEELAGFGPDVRCEESFRALMAQRGREALVLECRSSPAGGRATAERLVREHPEVTAVLVLNAEAAFGFVSGLARAGRRVPDDLSVLGLSSSREVGQGSDPVLTIMRAPGAELGRLGTEALIDQLESPDRPLTQRLLPCPLEPGESTGPAPAWVSAGGLPRRRRWFTR